MAGNIYAGGANTTGVGQRGRGGNNRNRNRNRGGGGGGGGGGKQPKGGLYGGKAGEAAANQNPEAYLESLFREADLYGGSAGSDFETFLRDSGMQDIVGGYQQAVAKNQRLSIEDYIKNTYGGAGFHGKKGKQFSAGTLSDELQKQFGTYSANQNPLTHAITGFNQQGLSATNGNEQFQNWLNTTYAPQLEAQWRTAQRDDPKINFDAWYAEQDPQAARRAYANRGPASRQFTGAPVGGRYSWWS